MSETWWLAQFDEVKPVEIQSSTAKRVLLLNGRYEAKDSDWRWYRPTREEAKAALIAVREKALADAWESVRLAEDRLEKARKA